MRISPRLSPESTPSTTLHESILSSVSSVRDSLPEQYRVHFETLRQEIIDFAASHDIPSEALAKPDLLRKAAEELPTKDLERLAFLLERFEHLIVKKEPWTNKEALEYGEKYYHLEKQYTAQVTLLEKSGILKEGAILGIDDKKYPIPTLEQIAIRLFERRETLETKHDQGFTKLLLVPFGMSLDTLRETLKQFLLDYKQKNSSFDLSTNIPLWTLGEYQGADIGDSPKLVYHSQSFANEGHGGKTKTEILGGQETPGQARSDNGRMGDNGWKGWTVHLFQPSNPKDLNSKGFASIPRKGQGILQGDLTPRPPFETDKFSAEYLSLLQSSKDNLDSPYFQESGMTPEDWIMAFMTHLTETGNPMDDWRTHKEGIPYLIGAFFPSSIFVPFAYWNRDIHHVRLDREEYCTHGENFGTRSSVMI
ncbi:TPA: hypothetical protein DDZ06_05170 [Candidatus Uhrbacteria bacterium]|uniref:Uncharacterized protein n=2 Tax=Candidatus Uhriibacteriota TaxID=1752732 RepID=A0A0G1SDZ1_9BACT|nr:MAG: hypothetical protein UX45_C0028G0009 [Candidatus Uhrbacteria bacterium GW2011_GWF2_46_218]KKU40333.1 MAG: hypothetical protein UX57_C0019G0009 [Candidatus Uhrbacteria bacterium GW2011_GWE2_46_68]HBK34375.1 hypothetical protein [Candidatus Uhrbacteria bacterium]